MADQKNPNGFRFGRHNGWTIVHEDDIARLDAALKPIQEEFHQVLIDAAATLGIATMGLRCVRPQLLDQVASANPDAHVILSTGERGDKDAIGYARWQVKTFPARLAKDGPIAEQFGHQWAIVIHSRWEHDFRPRLAEAAGIEKSEVAEPLAADIGRMRNDIVHHRGIATERNCGRCEFLKWFGSGERILITPKLVSNYMEMLGLVTLGPARGRSA